jgi:histidyl-tRNA synthetase
MQIPAGPKGTRDFYPEDMSLRQALFSSWRNTCVRYGFEEYDGPMFEHLELYTQKSGGEIEKQLYAFEDKGNRMIALRPELTPTLARMVAARGNNLKRPVRWFSIPRLFRYEKMQKGRLREFFQLNMDILGIAEETADAELIAASIDMMRNLGFTKDDFTVHISSRTLLEELFLSAGVERDKLGQLFAVLDKRHKIPQEESDAELAALIPPTVGTATVTGLLNAASLDDLKKSGRDLPSVDKLDRLFGLLDCYGMTDFCAFDIGIVRGLAYYTGIVFELFDKNRSMRAIAGGGRYDRLVKLYGGQDTPAVGFAAGDVVLGEMLREKRFSVSIPRSSIFIASFDDSHPRSAIRTAQTIRTAGISCEFSLKKNNIGKQMEQANSARASMVVFVGGDEEKQGNVKVRNMRSGQEMIVSGTELIPFLKNAVADSAGGPVATVVDIGIRSA